jgi:hypothetical protein
MHFTIIELGIIAGLGMPTMNAMPLIFPFLSTTGPLTQHCNRI